MADRTPQEFGAVPDGVTDSTVAIRAAIDAAGSAGDDLVIAGGVFWTSGQLDCPHDGLRIQGDGAIKAITGTGAWSPGAAMLEITGTGVMVDGDGLTLDQNDVIPNGDSLRAIGAGGLMIAGVVSRRTQRSFLFLGDDCTDVLVTGIDHQGAGHGLLVPDPVGLARITVRDSLFEHTGTGPTGDGIFQLRHAWWRGRAYRRAGDTRLHRRVGRSWHWVWLCPRDQRASVRLHCRELRG